MGEVAGMSQPRGAGSRLWSGNLLLKASVALRPHQARSRGTVQGFSLLDAMVLIAAASVGLGLDRAFWSETPVWGGSVPEDVHKP
jgi:hypothetical protein